MPRSEFHEDRDALKACILLVESLGGPSNEVKVYYKTES